MNGATWTIGLGAIVWVHTGWLMTPALAEPPTSEPTPTQTLSLDRLLDQAFEKAPGLRAKKRAYEGARARAVTAWLPDDPMVGVDVEGQDDLFNVGSRSNNEYMLQQTIPFPTELFLRGRIAARDAQMAFQRYKEEERNIAWHIEQPYYELFLAKKTRQTLEEIHTLTKKLVKTAQVRYESNQASQQDLLKAQIETSKVAVEIFDWREKEHVAEAHISHLLDQSLDSRYELAEPASTALPALSHAELEQIALRQRPELKAFEIAIERTKASRLLAKTEWLPDLTGRIEARQFRGEGGLREHDTFIGVTVPVWSLIRGLGGSWKAANKDVEEAEAMYGEMKNEVFLAIHEAASKMRSADNAVRTYDTLILPQARQQVDVALAGYEAGRTDFLTLIDGQRTLKEATIAYYKVVADYELGLSDLRLAIGGDWSTP